MKKKSTSQSTPARRSLGEGGFFNLRVLIGLFIILAFIFSAFAASAQELWVARYNGPGNANDVAYAIAVDSSGNVYVTGQSAGSSTASDYATIKYNTSGAQQWVARYNGPGSSSDIGTAVAIDGSGNVYVTGYSTGSGTGFDYATIKYNASGVQQWTARYNGPGNGNDYAIAIAVDTAGNVYVTGWSTGSASSGNDYDYTTIKYNASGVQQWVARYDGPANADDYANAIVVDSSGNVYVTGGSAGSGVGCFPICEDYATVKYNASGAQQWVARYNGPGNGNDHAVAIAVCGSGSVCVTGTSTGSDTLSDYATIKYDLSGNQQWVARYNGSANSLDSAYAMAVDSSGNVYVTGQSGLTQNLNDYATVKYNASGTQQWAVRYNGPGNSEDVARAIAVDGSGNTSVTGYSFGSGTGYDYATVRYVGSAQHVDRYNGPGNGNDVGFAIAIDGSGHVYVTGQSTGIGGHYDYATIKYSQ